MKTLLTIGLILTGTLTFGQVPVEKIYLTLTDGQHNIITDTSSTFKITFRQETDTIRPLGQRASIFGKNQKCQDTNYADGVNLNRVAYLKYRPVNNGYKEETWELYFYNVSNIPLDALGLYIIEITDTKTNWIMELLFRPSVIACQEATIIHRQGQYYICADTYNEK